MARDKQKKSKLTISLIRDGYKAIEDFIDDSAEGSIDIDGVGRVFFKSSIMRNPKWMQDFFLGVLDSQRILSSSANALLIVPLCDELGLTKPRFFALSFGYGKSLLKDNAIEERFGLITALNTVEEDGFRKITKTSIGGDSKTSSEQLPLKSSIADFGLDIDRELLNSITAVGEKEEPFAGALSGGLSLSLSAPVNINQVKDYLAIVYRQYSSDKYKELFPWIGRIQEVKEKNVIAQLDSNLLDAIRNDPNG